MKTKKVIVFDAYATKVFIYNLPSKISGSEELEEWLSKKSEIRLSDCSWFSLDDNDLVIEVR